MGGRVTSKARTNRRGRAGWAAAVTLSVAGGLVAGSAWGFVLLSAEEPKIDVSVGESVEIVWDGSAPGAFTDLGTWMGGRYQFSEPEEVMEVILTDALSRWSSVPGSLLRLTLSKDESVSADTADEIFTVRFADDGSETTAGGTYTNIESVDGVGAVIKACDITIDATSTTAEDMAIVMVHEMGHCVGLGHPHTSSASIMSYARDRSGPPSLSRDDKAGILYLYPDPSVIHGIDPKTGKARKKDLVTQAPEHALACGTIGGGSVSGTSDMSLIAMSLAPLVAMIALMGRRRRDSVSFLPESVAVDRD